MLTSSLARCSKRRASLIAFSDLLSSIIRIGKSNPLAIHCSSSGFTSARWRKDLIIHSRHLLLSPTPHRWRSQGARAVFGQALPASVARGSRAALPPRSGLVVCGVSGQPRVPGVVNAVAGDLSLAVGSLVVFLVIIWKILQNFIGPCLMLSTKSSIFCFFKL